MGNKRNRPKKSIVQLKRPNKPPRTTPTNPNFGVGTRFYPEVPGKFYVLGETVTKIKQERSRACGPFQSVLLSFHYVFGDDKTVAYYDADTGNWNVEGNNYLHILIFNGGQEVPE